MREARDEAEGPRAAAAEGATPKVEGRDHGGHGDALVVVAAADGAHDVRRDDGHDEGGGGGCALDAGALGCEEPRHDGRDGAEPRGDEDADVVEAHGEPEGLEDVVEPHGGELHARVDGGADGAPEGVPRGVVKPLEELLDAILEEVARRVEVEPRVELVDEAAVCLDGIQPDVVGLEGG